MAIRKPSALTLRWNKDMSISIYCAGRKVAKMTGSFANESAHSFMTGWFGTNDKTAWKTRWVIA